MQPTIQDMTDSERVLRVANELDVSEFEIFRRAFNDWHGSEAQDHEIEEDFAQYMYFGRAPLWVRHYTRMVMDSHSMDAGESTAWSRIPGLGSLADSRVGRFLLQ